MRVLNMAAILALTVASGCAAPGPDCDARSCLSLRQASIATWHAAAWEADDDLRAATGDRLVVLEQAPGMVATVKWMDASDVVEQSLEVEEPGSTWLVGDQTLVFSAFDPHAPEGELPFSLYALVDGSVTELQEAPGQDVMLLGVAGSEGIWWERTDGDTAIARGPWDSFGVGAHLPFEAPADPMGSRMTLIGEIAGDWSAFAQAGAARVHRHDGWVTDVLSMPADDRVWDLRINARGWVAVHGDDVPVLFDSAGAAIHLEVPGQSPFIGLFLGDTWLAAFFSGEDGDQSLQIHRLGETTASVEVSLPTGAIPIDTQQGTILVVEPERGSVWKVVPDTLLEAA